MSEQGTLELSDVHTSWWRCARCFCRLHEPVTWLWRNDKYGTALVKCSCCGWHWQEPGWEFVDGEWIDTHVALHGRLEPDQGIAVWSNPNPLGECSKAKAKGIPVDPEAVKEFMLTFQLEPGMLPIFEADPAAALPVVPDDEVDS